VRPKTLEEAWELNQKRSSRIIAGMMWTRLSKNNVGTAIDLCELGLDKIEETEDSFSIGAMVTLRDIETHKSLNAYTCGAVRDAVKSIVGVQFRNMATVGGSIWGRFGFSDVLTVFLAMDCYVELYKKGIVTLEEFNEMPRDRDLLVRIIIKKTPAKFVYTSMRNSVTDFPVIACALASINGEIRASVGARPGRAMLVRDSLNEADETCAEAFSRLVGDSCPVYSNTRASAEYRAHLIRVLVKRCVLELGGK